MNKYRLSVNFNLELHDDIQAREEAARIIESLDMYIIDTEKLDVKLQKIFNDKPPQGIEIPKILGFLIPEHRAKDNSKDKNNI